MTRAWLPAVLCVGACSVAPTEYHRLPRLQDAYVKASNTGPPGVHFGNAIALSSDGSTLAVGAFQERSAATGVGGNELDISATDAGAVYVFTRTDDGWSQQAYVKASNTGAGDMFGTTVALSADGSTLAVGARGEASGAAGIGGDETNDDRLNAGAVYIFTRTDGVWSQHAYIKATNPDAEDYFGAALALSGDGKTLAVGAYGEDSDANVIIHVQVDSRYFDNDSQLSGAVYVFARTETSWKHQAYVKAFNVDANDAFGTSVALSGDGDTLAVGAPGESTGAPGIGPASDEAARSAGAVYVLTRADGTWAHETFIKTSNAGIGDNFGRALALSEDASTLVVSAPDEDSGSTGVGGAQGDNTPNSGAAYVFARAGGTWREEAYVKALNTDTLDDFGASIAVSAAGDVLLVGALTEDGGDAGVDAELANNETKDAGAAYVYLRTDGVWRDGHYIKPSNPGVEDHFGASVTSDGAGTTFAVGANLEDSRAHGVGGDDRDNSVLSAGAAYVFR